MDKPCCYFEDELLENFHPLTLTRPIYDLRIGIFTLAQKWDKALQTSRPICGTIREHLRGVFEECKIDEKDSEIYWINPRFIPTQELVKQIKKLSINKGLVCKSGSLIAAFVDRQTHQTWMGSGISQNDIENTELPDNNLTEVKNIWELFQLNGQQIRRDINWLNQAPFLDNINDRYPHVTFSNPGEIYIEQGAIIEPGTILIADSGPIFIGENAHIMAGSILRGATAICNYSVVKMGAKIYEDTTIGPVCKVGGEISNSIFHSYSNKAHDGYAGNSVFGQWCNLGADTNTSNLKNNYSTVKVRDWHTSKMMDTGQQFIGTIMGDHSKTGINSMLNTGTLCGVCCNLFSDGYPPKHVPSFSWVSGNNIVPYHFEKAIEAMEKMMKRRSVEFTPAYEKMMRAIFRSTSF